jgi:hypothetical protein
MLRSAASPTGSGRNSGSAEGPGQGERNTHSTSIVVSPELCRGYARAGGAGNAGALAPIMNAVVDALSPLGITMRHRDGGWRSM